MLRGRRSDPSLDQKDEIMEDKVSKLYQDYEDSDRMDRYGRDGVNHLFRGKRPNHLLRGRRSTSGSKI